MAEIINNDAEAQVKAWTEKAQRKLTRKLIKLINSEFNILLIKQLQEVFDNVLIWFKSDEEEVDNKLRNLGEENHDQKH